MNRYSKCQFYSQEVISMKKICESLESGFCAIIILVDNNRMQSYPRWSYHPERCWRLFRTCFRLNFCAILFLICTCSVDAIRVCETHTKLLQIWPSGTCNVFYSPNLERYAGHYIFLVGFDPNTDEVLFLDPSSDSGMKYVSSGILDVARSQPGTDKDVIIIKKPRKSDGKWK